MIEKLDDQPTYDRSLEKKRLVDGIMLEHAKGKDPQDRLPAYKRKFTPITAYAKNQKDTRVTRLHRITQI